MKDVKLSYCIVGSCGAIGMVLEVRHLAPLPFETVFRHIQKYKIQIILLILNLVAPRLSPLWVSMFHQSSSPLHGFQYFISVLNLHLTDHGLEILKIWETSIVLK